MKKLIEDLCKNNMEYLFLSQFISSDTITSVDEAKKSLETISKVRDALIDADIPDEKKDEFREYLNDGEELIKRDWL